MLSPFSHKGYIYFSLLPASQSVALIWQSVGMCSSAIFEARHANISSLGSLNVITLSEALYADFLGMSSLTCDVKLY